MTLYFASQGSGHMLGPVLAGTVRLVLVAGAGVWLVASNAPAWQLFTLVGAGMVAYGLATVASIRVTRWGPRTPPQQGDAGIRKDLQLDAKTS